MSGRIGELQAKLFGVADVVCAGHGARWPQDRLFTVPAGVTILFYCRPGAGLPNDVGQQVDQVVNGGPAPPVVETVAAGSPCLNYRLFTPKAGGYLNLKMSKEASDRYITTNSKDVGVHLKDLVDRVVGRFPFVRIHWSACRVVESGTAVSDWSEPKYEGALAKLATQTSKTL